MILKNVFFPACVVLSVGFVAALALSQGQPKEPVKPQEPKAGAPAAEGAMQMPQPVAEHRALLENVGQWTAKIKNYESPGAPPAESSGRETVRAVGGFWTAGEFEATFMGAPFSGSSLNGYSVEKKKYVTYWVDSFNPEMMVFEGNYDADKKVLTMKCSNMMNGAPAEWRSTDVKKDADTHVFTMYCAMGGTPEMKMMEIEYKRKK